MKASVFRFITQSFALVHLFADFQHSEHARARRGSWSNGAMKQVERWQEFAVARAVDAKNSHKQFCAKQAAAKHNGQWPQNDRIED